MMSSRPPLQTTTYNSRVGQRSEGMKALLSSAPESPKRPVSAPIKPQSPVVRATAPRSTRSILGDVESPVRVPPNAAPPQQTANAPKELSVDDLATPAQPTTLVKAATIAAPLNASGRAVLSASTGPGGRAALQAEITALTAQNANLTRQLAEAEKRVAKETAARQKAELDNQRSISSAEEAKAALAKEKAETARLSLELKKTENMLASLRRTETLLRSQLDEQTSVASKAVAAAKSSAQQHEATVTSLNHELAKLKKLLSEQERKVAVKEQERTHSSLTLQRENAGRLEAQMALAAATEEANRQIKVLAAQVSKLENDLVAEKERTALANRECDFAMRRAKQSAEDATSVAAALRQTMELLQSSDATVESLRERVAKQEAVLQNAQHRADILLKQHAEALTKVTGDLETHQNAVTVASRDADRSKSASAQAEQRRQAAEAQLSLEKARAAALERALEEAIGVDAATLKHEVNERAMQIAALEKTCAALKEANLAYSQQYTAELTMRKRAEETAEERTAELMAELVKLREELTRVEATRANEMQAYLMREQQYELRIKALEAEL